MPRFAILEHNHPRLHWDLLLEEGDHLRAWRLMEPPRAGSALAAEAIADHRLMYLNYEGPVSGGRGEVRRWDGGDYVIQKSDDFSLNIVLQGKRVRGHVTLQRQNDQKWLVGFDTMTETEIA
jgi:hypothetical protein